MSNTVQAVNYIIRSLTTKQSGFVTNAVDDAVFLHPDDDAYEVRIETRRRVFSFEIEARELMLISSSSKQLFDLVSNKLADAQARFRGDIIRDLLEHPVNFAGDVDEQALLERFERTGSKLLELAEELRKSLVSTTHEGART